MSNQFPINGHLFPNFCDDTCDVTLFFLDVMVYFQNKGRVILETARPKNECIQNFGTPLGLNHFPIPTRKRISTVSP